jgi:monoamine oxidase
MEDFVAMSSHGVSSGRDVSAHDFAKMTEEVEDRLVREGMDLITEAFSWGLPIKTKTPVSKIATTSDGVVVSAKDGDYHAKQVIVTTSPAVLSSGAIRFDPPLPDWKTKALSDIAMGKYGKVVLEFDRNVFSKVSPGTRIYDTSNPDGVVEYVIQPFGDNVVIALYGGKMSDAMEQKGRMTAIAEAKAQIAKIFGESEVNAAFMKGAVTSWGSDPLTRGSFSAAKPGDYDARAKAGEPIGPIVFAGEAVAPPKWNATIAGAYLSGDAAAERVLHPDLAALSQAHGDRGPSASTGLDGLLDERVNDARDGEADRER